MVFECLMCGDEGTTVTLDEQAEEFFFRQSGTIHIIKVVEFAPVCLTAQIHTRWVSCIYPHISLYSFDISCLTSSGMRPLQ